jgi:hypothetical protein
MSKQEEYGREGRDRRARRRSGIPSYRCRESGNRSRDIPHTRKKRMASRLPLESRHSTEAVMRKHLLLALFVIGSLFAVPQSVRAAAAGCCCCERSCCADSCDCCQR